MRLKTVVSFIFLLVCTLPVSALTPQEIAQSLMTSTVILEMKKSGGSSNGVGFIIAEGKIATNYHVIEGMSVGTVRLIGTKKKYEIDSVFNTDIGYDLSIVSAKVLDNQVAPALPLGDSDIVKKGDTVYALTNPQKVIGSFSDGVIESISPENSHNIDGKLFKGKLFVVTMPLQPGSSGGAVLNASGKIIGVIVAKFQNRNAGLVIPINYAKNLLSQNQGQSNTTIVEIPDLNLKSLLRKQLNKNVGDPITVDDMLGIFEIKGRYEDIKNLSGLEYAKNLTSLNLYSSDEISDLSPLSDLINLEYLNIAGQEKIVDLSPLAKLTQLKVLNLRSTSYSKTGFDDIAALSNLTNLEILNLGNNRVWNLSPLSKMRKLEELYVHTNLIFDIEPLLILNNLKTVDLRKNPLNQNSKNSVLPALAKKGVKYHLSYLYFAGPEIIPKGETITLDLNIKDAVNLSTINLDINVYTQDYSVVEIIEGDFMGQNEALTFFINGTREGTNIEDISVVRLNKGGANGDGTVLQLKIRGDNIGGKNIYFDAELTDIDGEETFHGEQYRYFLEVVASTDVNGDGVVDINDLQYVIDRMGKGHGENPDADLNGDEYVNVKDFAIVAAALEDSPIASIDTGQSLVPYLAPSSSFYPEYSRETIENWIDMMEAENDGLLAFQRGIANLERLLMGLRPDTTTLLLNYPNPFNPETWIPYHLAEAADVQLTIYDIKGEVVRQFDLGHQIAGYYTNRTKAVYWDGRNELGETVASGIYFYQLSAGDYSATRRMVILK